jgi:lipoprotein-releasing system ATP-binding protein
MSEPVVKLLGVERTYRQGEKHLHVLQGADLRILPGEIVALVGPSGAGKSTLLHIAGLLEDPDQGEVTVTGQECSQLSDDERTALRRTKIGFIYQFHHLLPEFSAVENIMIPLMANGIEKRRARDAAFKLVEGVGLSDRSSHRPAQLSGGEQQRVAIARALSNSPMVLLADEPTGNLDNQTALGVFQLLQELVRDRELGALVATHNLDLARKMDRILRLENGLLETVG